MSVLISQLIKNVQRSPRSNVARKQEGRRKGKNGATIVSSVISNLSARPCSVLFFRAKLNELPYRVKISSVERHRLVVTSRRKVTWRYSVSSRAYIVAATLLWLIACHLIIINATGPVSFQPGAGTFVLTALCNEVKAVH